MYVRPRAAIYRASLALVSMLAFAGCGGNSSPETQPPTDGLLKKVASASELEASIKSWFTTVTPAAPEALAVGAGTGAGTDSANFTGTYTQEKNVDEFDAVRYDGEHLYVAPRRFITCCFVLAQAAADGASNTGNPAQASIRILETDATSASATLAGTIPLEDGISVQGMYVDDDRLFALTAKAYYGQYGDLWSSIAIWAPERLGFRIYDTADPGAPTLETDVSIDGVFVESRRIGNVVYIVSRYTPQVPGLIYNPQTSADLAHNEQVLANLTLDEMLPTITVDGAKAALVDPLNCYVSNDPDMPGYPVITSVTAVPIDNPEAFVNTCYNDDVYGVYVSEAAIYFPQIINYLYPQQVRTRIHKFSLGGTSMVYRGSADIDGQLWRGGQADFRMNEQDGYLRVLASDYLPSNTDFVDHLLYVLHESPTETALDIVSRLPNDAHPEPIGKPNEQLYGVRFLGDRAYAVTFRQIDPLYVIDLANPADPQIVGDLAVTGFSDFLHPVADDLLLGLGSGAAGGVKLELFDVSDPSAPSSRGSMTIGDDYSYSEARWDRHAFTYQADVAEADRFTVPVTTYNAAGSPGYSETALYLFEIRNKTTPSLASLIPVGRLAPPVTDEFAYGERSRSYLHDDTIYYVLDENVWSAYWLSPTLVNGPF